MGQSEDWDKPWMQPIRYNDSEPAGEPERAARSAAEVEAHIAGEPTRSRESRAGRDGVSVDNEPLVYRSGVPGGVLDIDDQDELTLVDAYSPPVDPLKGAPIVPRPHSSGLTAADNANVIKEMQDELLAQAASKGGNGLVQLLNVPEKASPLVSLEGIRREPTNGKLILNVRFEDAYSELILEYTAAKWLEVAKKLQEWVSISEKIG